MRIIKYFDSEVIQHDTTSNTSKTITDERRQLVELTMQSLNMGRTFKEIDLRGIKPPVHDGLVLVKNEGEHVVSYAIQAPCKMSIPYLSIGGAAEINLPEVHGYCYGQTTYLTFVHKGTQFIPFLTNQYDESDDESFRGIDHEGNSVDYEFSKQCATSLTTREVRDGVIFADVAIKRVLEGSPNEDLRLIETTSPQIILTALRDLRETMPAEVDAYIEEYNSTIGEFVSRSSNIGSYAITYNYTLFNLKIAGKHFDPETSVAFMCDILCGSDDEGLSVSDMMFPFRGVIQ